MMKTLLLLLLITVQFKSGNCKGGPCAVYIEISDLLKRSPSYKQDVMPLCDNHLTTGWYRAGYLKMPTSPPDLGSCGTYYPYWLNGDHPSTNETRDAKICKVGITNPCSESMTISIKNCSAYMVYRLPPLECCNSAYCFVGPTRKCKFDVSLNPVVSYYNITWFNETNSKVFVTRYNPSVNLICKFSPLPDETLFYDISWYVDDIEAVKGQLVTSRTLGNALLSSRDILVKNKTAGSMIHCIVGIKSTKTGFPCDAKASPLFFAGIEVLTPQLYIEKGGKALVQLRVTIPYATENLVYNNYDLGTYDLPVFLNFPNNSSLGCDIEYLKRDRCEVLIKGYSFKERAQYETDVWKQVYNVSISYREDGDFEMLDKGISLQLKTGETYGIGGSLFSNLKLPDVQVYTNKALISSTESTTKRTGYCESSSSTTNIPVTMLKANTPLSTTINQNANLTINANVSKCNDMNVSVYSKENCYLATATPFEKLTVPVYAFVIAMGIFLFIIMMILVGCRCRLASTNKEQRKNENPDKSCHKRPTGTGLVTPKTNQSNIENENNMLSEGQTICKNEYTCITELDEIMSKQNSHLSENIYQRLDEKETHLYECLGEDNNRFYEGLSKDEPHFYEQLPRKGCI